MAGIFVSGPLEGIDGGMDANTPILRSRALMDDEVGVVDAALAFETEVALARAADSLDLDTGTGMGMEGGAGCEETEGPLGAALRVGYQADCAPLGAVLGSRLPADDIVLGLEADDDVGGIGSCGGVDDDTDAFREDGAVFERFE